MTELWTERHRPKTMDDYVWNDVDQRRKVEEWIKMGYVPSHLLFSGSAGVGKTSLARLILHELKIPNSDIMEINASRERKVDEIQARWMNFVSTWAMGDSGIKYIIFDECLSEDESIMMSDGSTKQLCDFEDFVEHKVKSYNMTTGQIEDDIAYVISKKNAEIFEVELEDDRTIKTTLDHPFLVLNEQGHIVAKLLRYFQEGDLIVSTGNTQTATIRSIKSLGVSPVVNLSVQKNHTFITANGIPTHNCDALSPLSQRMLRSELETYSDICRVLFCCNYLNKVIEPIRNRCQTMNFEALNRDEFLSRMVQILDIEKVDFIDEDGGLDTLESYISRAYPSMRKCINLVQENIVDGKLRPPKIITDDDQNKDYVIEMLSLFASGKYTEARKIIISQAQPEEYPELYRYLYQNLHFFGDSRAQQDEALLKIRDAIVNHNMVADQEINLAACLSELTSIAMRA